MRMVSKSHAKNCSIGRGKNLYNKRWTSFCLCWLAPSFGCSKHPQRSTERARKAASRVWADEHSATVSVPQWQIAGSIFRWKSITKPPWLASIEVYSYSSSSPPQRFILSVYADISCFVFPNSMGLCAFAFFPDFYLLTSVTPFVISKIYSVFVDISFTRSKTVSFQNMMWGYGNEPS